MAKPEGLDEAARIYKSFHGTEPEEAIQIDLDDRIPETLIVLGRLVALEYEIIGGGRKKEVYRHEMGDVGKGPKKDTLYYLCTDTSKRRFWLIPDNPNATYPYFGPRGMIG